MHSTAQHSTAQHTILYLKTGRICTASRYFLGCLKHYFHAPQVAALCIFILIGTLLPHPARAALDCTVKSTGLWLGHGNIYTVPKYLYRPDHHSGDW